MLPFPNSPLSLARDFLKLYPEINNQPLGRTVLWDIGLQLQRLWRLKNSL
jgi:hypothetical protein